MDICTRCEKNEKYYFEMYCKECEAKLHRNRKVARNRKRKAVEKRLQGLQDRTIKAGLPYCLTVDDFLQLHKDFDHKCAITESERLLTVDHFIPLSIGHGGTYLGNIFPLNFDFNEWKDTENPFEWKRSLKRLKYRQRFNQLVDYLARQNELTRSDFVDYVYWCFNNPRSKAFIAADGEVSSIELWKKSGKGRG
ncbi:hypothetical protein SMD22_02020 (plasmid) [Brevibacillus halotolerans]|nr:hypothetical protein SMD22_02020 [Brevibacillus halotolerans]